MAFTRAERSRRRLFVATAVIVALIAADAVSGGAVRGVVRRAASSLWGVTTAIGEWRIFASHGELVAENAQLSAEVAALQAKLGASAADEVELANLRATDHLAGIQSGGGVTAPVVSSTESSPYGTFLLGAGSNDGVRANDLVLSPDGYVIGTVATDDAHTALVKELFAPGQSIAAIIRGTPISLAGRGGGNAQAELPTGSGIAVGDVAFSPQLRQLPIGVVGAISQTSGDTSLIVYVRTSVSLGSLQFVYVEHRMD